jgi:hypothetical protein
LPACLARQRAQAEGRDRVELAESGVGSSEPYHRARTGTALTCISRSRPIICATTMTLAKLDGVSSALLER